MNEYLSLLVERFVSIEVILVHNKNNTWFNDDRRRGIDLKQDAHLRWTRDHSRVNWDEFVHFQRRANVVDSEAGRQFRLASEAGMFW